MVARPTKEFWFSQCVKETFPYCAPYTTASLLSSSLPCWPPNGCHICRLKETLWLTYVSVSRCLRVDLNPRFCESAIMHSHCFTDVSHLYSWERFVMRQQWRPENQSQSMVALRERDWSGQCAAHTRTSPLFSRSGWLMASCCHILTLANHYAKRLL